MPLANDVAERTTAVVLAGGKGTRLDPLTRKICKPALPFGGTFRCIDFSLSNCVNSGIRTIGVATQHQPDALLYHLWSRWNATAVGDAAVIHAWRAEERAARFGYCGTADAVYRNLGSIQRAGDSLALILAGDHVYKMDYRPMLEAHCARNATATIGCVRVPATEARRFGVLTAGDDGRIEQFVEKPRVDTAWPAMGGDHVLASMGIYVFDAALLAAILHADARDSSSTHDFGSDILPQLIAGGRAYSYAFGDNDGGAAGGAYWRDIGTLRTYWQAHLDLLGPRPLLELDDPRWPLGRAAAAPRIITSPTRAGAGGVVEDSVISPTASITGQLCRSVACDGVEIGRGASVVESVVLPGAVIGSGCRLQGVIVDAGYRVRDGTVIEQRADVGEPPVLSIHSEKETRLALGG